MISITVYLSACQHDLTSISLVTLVWWLSSLVVRASDLRLSGREFNPQLPHYWLVCTEMDDRLRVDIRSQYVTRHPSPLSLLPSVG